MPGFVEIDLVGHEGGNSSGEFCFTLTMTDIATGWTINRSVKNKAAIWVFEAIDHAIAQFPFPILGIDSDNGSEFINAHLFDYCTERKITFTRSRPGNKNDGAHVEQKNWTHVRELVGYLRFDTDAELAVLNRIWELDRASPTPGGPAEAVSAAPRRQGHQAPRPGRHPLDGAPRPARSVTEYELRTAKDRDHGGSPRGHLPVEHYRTICRLCDQLERVALNQGPRPGQSPR